METFVQTALPSSFKALRKEIISYIRAYLVCNAFYNTREEGKKEIEPKGIKEGRKGEKREIICVFLLIYTKS